MIPRRLLRSGLLVGTVRCSMADVDEPRYPADGRAARRERNIDAVLDVVLAMFAEGALFPSIEQVAKRSGLSLRSLYRYFADPAELLEAAIRRHWKLTEHLVALPTIGQGPLGERIDDFVAMRSRLYEGVEAAWRATVHNAPRNTRLREQMERARRDLRSQFERQFDPELSQLKGADREAILAAGDLLTQLDAVEFLRGHRRFSVAETERTLRTGLSALLGG